MYTYQKTRPLLQYAGYNYSSFDEVPDNLKSEIYDEFVREIDYSDFAEYVCDRQAQEDYAILVSSDSESAQKLFFNNRKIHFKQKCDNTLCKLFYEEKPSYKEIKERNREERSFLIHDLYKEVA